MFSTVQIARVTPPLKVDFDGETLEIAAVVVKKLRKNQRAWGLPAKQEARVAILSDYDVMRVLRLVLTDIHSLFSN